MAGKKTRRKSGKRSQRSSSSDRTPAGERVKQWYDTPQWRELRRKHLLRYPYCNCPQHRGKRVRANIVDHIEPHHGNEALFWDQNNLQSLTKECHDGPKRRKEKSGLWPGSDANGEPADPEHPWHR